MKCFSFFLTACLAATAAYADPVPEFDYQGKVLVNDQAFTGTGYFRLALSNEGSTNLWETAELTNEVFKGVFSFTLGDASMPAIDPDIFSSGEDLYLRVWFSTNGTSFDEMLPPQKLSSAPYAINADRLDGYDSSDFLTSFTEKDPVWAAVSNDVMTKSANGQTAFEWGDHAEEGYLTAESDPVWLAQKSGYATGTPLYAYTETDPVYTSAVKSILFTNTAFGGDVSGTGTTLTVTKLQGRAVSTNAPVSGYILQWTNSTWTPAPAPAAGAESDPVYTGEKSGILFTNTAAAGDLSGTIASPTVAKLQGRPVAATAPALNHLLQWNGSAWTNAPPSAGGAESDPIYTNEKSTILFTSTYAGGDISGTFDSLQISSLQGKPVYAATPTLNYYLKYDGDNWVPAPVSLAGAETDPVYTAAISRIIFTNTAAGGDLGGVYPRPIVTGLQGRAISGIAPTNGSILQWNGTNWAPVTLSSVAGKSYGTVNTMDAPGPGSALDIVGAGGISVSNVPGDTNKVEISSTVPLLQNVIWVATNGTASGPGNIDSPYNNIQIAAGAAYGKYGGQPSAVVVAAGKYTNNVVITNGNLHIFGLNRPTIGKVQVLGTTDSTRSGKMRLENLVIDSTVDITGSDVKLRNCRIMGQVTINGPNVELQDCAIMTNITILSSASNVLIQSCTIEKTGFGLPYALDIGAAYNVQVLNCEIVNKDNGAAVKGPTSAASTPPLYHLSHNVIKGIFMPGISNTIWLTHSIIQGRLAGTPPANMQHFANNVIIGTNTWVQYNTEAMTDAHGNTIFTNSAYTIPDPWND